MIIIHENRVLNDMVEDMSVLSKFADTLYKLKLASKLDAIDLHMQWLFRNIHPDGTS